VRDDDRVEVGVDDPGARAGHLVHVALGRDTRADVQELADPGVAQEPDGADEEGPVLPRGDAHLRHVPQPDLGHLPVGGEVVPAAQHVVVDPSRMRDIDADAQLDPAFPRFPLTRGAVVSGH